MSNEVRINSGKRHLIKGVFVAFYDVKLGLALGIPLLVLRRSLLVHGQLQSTIK